MATRVCFLSIVVLLATSCADVRTTSSDILEEEAAIKALVYSPSRHDVNIVPTIDFDVNVGLDVDHVYIKEKFAVIFRCKHGDFTVERKEIYDKFLGHENKKVFVTYREVYRETWEDQDNDGEDELISRDLIDYDFLEANFKPIPIETE